MVVLLQGTEGLQEGNSRRMLPADTVLRQAFAMDRVEAVSLLLQALQLEAAEAMQECMRVEETGQISYIGCLVRVGVNV